MNDAVEFVAASELLADELDDLELHVLCGEEHIENKITNPRVQKPGLAFAGYYEYIKPGRVQIIGESEINFIASLDEPTRKERFDAITRLEIPLMIVTKGLAPDPLLVKLCCDRGVPITTSQSLSSVVIKRVSNVLEDRLVPSTRLHGVLLEVYGLGVLLMVARPLTPIRRLIVGAMGLGSVLVFIVPGLRSFYALGLPRPTVVLAAIGIVALTAAVMYATLRASGWWRELPTAIKQLETLAGVNQEPPE